MCGIVSLWLNQPVAPATISAATDALIHRGPDGGAHYFSPDHCIALGHRRLSIIDLEGGTQPLRNEDGTIIAVVNGELYGHAAIRDALRARGHVFATQSDSEIIVHLYEEYGADCVAHLRGEFAFVLYDVKRNRMMAARDRFGIKPLCYAHDASGLRIASEAKAILASGHKGAWDSYAFNHACSMQYVPTNRTLFAGIHQLPPGHILFYDGRDVSVRQYWDMDFPVEPVAENISEQDAAEQVAASLEEAVKLRLQADVPVCAHLSGGIDSSSVAALASKVQGRPIDCFTVSFDHAGYDELPVAQEMADHIGAKLHVVKVSQDDLVYAIPDAVYRSEGLAINGHLAGKYLLNKAIRAGGFKVALTGEGADEVLAGYPHLREDVILQGNDNQADALRALYSSNDKLAGVFLSHGDTLPTIAVQNALGYVPSFLRAKASLGFRVSALLCQQPANDMFADMISGIDTTGQLAGRHVVNQSSYLWSKLTLANYILRTLGDGCEMAHSVEGRLPFLDHELFAQLRALPMHMKIRQGQEKYVLRQAMRPYITDTLFKREKHPFIAPPVSKFSNKALDTYVQDMLHTADFAAMPFWDGRAVKTWLNTLPTLSDKDKVAAEPVLMMLLTSFLIHQQFKLNEVAA